MNTKFCLSLLLPVLFAPFLAVAQEKCLYEITAHPERREQFLSVEVHCTGLPAGDMTLTTTRHFGQIKDLQFVQNLSGKGADGRWVPLEHIPDSSDWKYTSDRGMLDLRYDIDTSKKTLNFNEDLAGTLSLPNFFENAVTFKPFFLLVGRKPGPKERLEQADGSYTLSIKTPKGWRSDGLSVRNASPLEFAQYQNSYVLIYKVNQVRQFREGNIQLAWLSSSHSPKGPKGNDPKYARKLLQLLHKILESFESPRLNKDSQFLIILSALDPKSNLKGWHGEAGTRSLLLTYNAAALNPQKAFSLTSSKDSIAAAVAHEFIHFWGLSQVSLKTTRESGPEQPEEGGNFRWFTEGFTDYLAHYFLFHFGYTSPEEFASVLEDRLQTSSSPEYATMNLIQASQQFFDNSSASNLCYVRGLLAAFELDTILRKNSPKSLLSFLRILINDQEHLADDPYKNFKITLEKYSKQSLDQFLPAIESTQQIELENMLKSLGGEKTISYAYRLGAEISPDAKPGSLCPINLPQRLRDFGFKDGDCIVEVGHQKFEDRNQLYRYQDKPVPLTILRDNKKREVSVTLIKVPKNHWKFSSKSPFATF